MARIARIVAPGMPHHITQRGNRRLGTFGDAPHICSLYFLMQCYIDVMPRKSQNRIATRSLLYSRVARELGISMTRLSGKLNVSLSGEIENEAFEAKSAEEKRRKPIVSQTKLSPEGYGGLSSQMFRLMKTIGRLSEVGKIVIVTALLQQNPKWDHELAAAPALKGREFPTSMPGFFDLIGLVESRVKR